MYFSGLFPAPTDRRRPGSARALRAPADFLIALSLAAILLPVGVASAQLPSLGSSGDSNDVKRPSEEVDFFQLLESGEDLVIELLQPDSEEPTVENPQWNAIDSPQTTTLTFLEAMNHVEFGREEAWPRALKTLDVPDEYERSPRDAARDLKSVFDRLTKISASMLPGEKLVRAENMSRYEIFPYGVESQWVWETLEEPPTGKIEILRGDDGSWRFSQATVRQSEALAESMRPIPPRSRSRPQGELFLFTFRPLFEQTSWWGWLAFAGCIVGGAVAAYFLWRSLHKFERRFERDDDRIEFIRRFLRILRAPLAIAVFTIACLFGSTQLHLGPTLDDFRWATAGFFFVIAFGWLLVEVVDLLLLSLQRFLASKDDQYARMSAAFVSRMVRVVVGILLFLFVVQNMLEWNITALLGGIGLVALAVSLAAKDAVKNVFGALMIFTNRPFQIGDWVSFRDRIGEVEDVGLQVTRIRILSGELWSIPNMSFIDESIDNLSLRSYLRREMNIQIPYDTPPDKIARALEVVDEVLRSDEVVEEGNCDLEERAPIISFNEFGPHYFNILVYYWYFIGEGDRVQRNSDRGWFSYLAHCDIVNRRLVERFEDEGIEFAFPTQTLYLTDDPERRLAMAIDRNGDGREHEDSAGATEEGRRRDSGRRPGRAGRQRRPAPEDSRS